MNFIELIKAFMYKTTLDQLKPKTECTTQVAQAGS
jgi:hypothetical protein